MKLTLKSYEFDLKLRPLVMGILNVTPDSFWDGGKYRAPQDALLRAHKLHEEGADIIDVGGESTRPGSSGVGVDEELERVGPVVEKILKEIPVPVSIDTRKAAVARQMLSLGAHLVNDVSGLTYDPEMVNVIREFDVPVVIMHMRGTPLNMQEFTQYADVVEDVKSELLDRISIARRTGLRQDQIIIDPGIGFSKTAEQCVEIIARLDQFTQLGYPVLIGPSRKSFIGKTLYLDPELRLEPTITCCLWAALKGANIVRVHDVGSVVRALRMLEELKAHAKPSKAGTLE